MLGFKLVYHPGYDLHLGDHIFPSEKYRMVQQRLLHERIAEPEDFVEPEPATDEDLLLVHHPDWIRRLKTGSLSFQELLRLEVPFSREMVRAVLLATGGSILAARLALEGSVAFNLSGGFHHAFPDHGEGFCAIHDVAVALRRLQRDGSIRRAMVVDCDVHQGNGTAYIFRDDPSVFTLSIHQYNNYPSPKPPSDIDIHLPDGVGDEEYLDLLRGAYLPALDKFRPELVAYIAGADPYEEDQLGGLCLTMEGLRRRDRLVLQAALEHNAAIFVTLAGGYAMRVEDTVTIHINTVKVAREALAKRRASRSAP
ncbi:MAG: histone deacetylase [Bryobacterales bacterium]|nr:histone deacetylase [Bryobacteraceae bacterium]MDW8131057.1 histone deacetylase [Bryobacterales bacterium]